jgi:hypothetical protein
MAKFAVTTPDGQRAVVEAPSPEEAARLVTNQGAIEAASEAGLPGRVAGAILKRGLTDVPKFIAGAIQRGGDELEKVFPITPERLKYPMASTDEAIDWLTGGAPAKGQNLTEKLAIEGGAGAVSGALMAPSLATKASQIPGLVTAGAIGGAGSGIGAETAEALNPGNPITRIVGALLGGLVGAPASYMGTGGGAARRVNELTRGIPDARLADAQNLMQRGKELGVPLNLPQAMPDQPTPLAALSEDASRSTSGPQHTMIQTGQNKQAKEAAEQGVGMFGLPDADPTTTAMKTQEAATAAVKRADKLPGKVAGDEYSFKEKMAKPQEIKAVDADLRDEIERIGPTTSAGRFLQQEVLGKIWDKKNQGYILDHEQLKTILNEAKAAIGKPTLKTPGLEGRSAEQARKALEGTLEKYLSSKMVNKEQGDTIYKQGKEAITEPMQRSPVGQIAGPAGLDPEAPTKVDQIFKVLDSPNIRAQSISKMQVDLDKSAPGTFAAYSKAAMERKLEKAFSGKGQTPIDAPTAFSQAMWGGPGQKVARENFRATMAASARSLGKSPEQAAEFVRGMEKLMEVMEAAGRSKVITNTPQGKNLAFESAVDVGRAAVYTPQAPGALNRISQALTSDATRRKVFDMIWTPEGVDQIRSYAAMDIPAVRAAFAASLVAPAVGNQEK